MLQPTTGELVWMLASESEAGILTFFLIPVSPAGSFGLDLVSELGVQPSTP